jgi:hypothetical protein
MLGMLFVRWLAGMVATWAVWHCDCFDSVCVAAVVHNAIRMAVMHCMGRLVDKHKHEL